jgi:uncharacterized protein (TIGR02301 family)
VRRVWVILLAAGLAAPAAGQQRPRAQQPAAPSVPAEPVPELPLIYEPQLQRLSETLGVIAYVTQLCGDADGDSWRLRAEQLIEAESVTQSRKERLAGAFNRGFLGHQAAHRACTDRSRAVIERMIRDAREITQDLANRFGG